ncbi:MAG TPA: acetoacetate--CoA ligase [Chitinophagaceae bacterium]|nr:acetoacetate--CoA ligase [Chitinophagaceae bacterium]
MKINQEPLWTPGKDLLEKSWLTLYMKWLATHRSLEFENYDAIWTWSVEHPADFWESFLDYSGLITHGQPDTILEEKKGMIGTAWFKGLRVNYAENIFSHASPDTDALVFRNERGQKREIGWPELERSVAALAAWLRDHGVEKGDRVASVMPNIPETVIAFLAVQSIGAVWSSCSPDFGNPSIVDRFYQIEPKVLFVTDGYQYNGKQYSKIASWEELRGSLPSLENLIFFPYADASSQMAGTVRWDDVMLWAHGPLQFEPVNFDHPLWILYSSGTTGKPKAITHSVGGNLIEHLKVLLLHWDVKAGEKFFWYSTTGWMMWNFSVASMLAGATLVLYDGSAGYPDLNVLWDLAREEEVQHFGGGAAFFIANMKAGMRYREIDLPALRTIGSTGSPLPHEAFEWIYRDVKKDVWLISFSGGTDICSGFVGGCPHLPVYAGEIQCRLLGCYLESFNEMGQPVRNELGEMVILKPMPSMPIYFWNDEDHKRYQTSYFDHFPGVWRHGDWIEITDRGSVIIYGRSDATLNRDGVRIGTSEVYRAVDAIEEIQDSLVVCVEREGGQYYMPLYVVMKTGYQLTDDIRAKIRKQLREQYSPRHVPDEIISVPDIPYTISGKKMETPVKKILMGVPVDLAASRDTMKNPEALGYFGRAESREQ